MPRAWDEARASHHRCQARRLTKQPCAGIEPAGGVTHVGGTGLEGRAVPAADELRGGQSGGLVHRDRAQEWLFRAIADAGDTGTTDDALVEQLGDHPRYVRVWCLGAYAFELLAWDAAGAVVVSEIPYPDEPTTYRSNPVYRAMAGVQLHEALIGCGMITQGQLGELLEDAGFDNVRVATQPHANASCHDRRQPLTARNDAIRRSRLTRPCRRAASWRSARCAGSDGLEALEPWRSTTRAARRQPGIEPQGQLTPTSRCWGSRQSCMGEPRICNGSPGASSGLGTSCPDTCWTVRLTMRQACRTGSPRSWSTG